MKTHSKPTPGSVESGSRQRRKGVALLTVLTIISLSTILILTFFQLAQNEMVSSASYNNGLEAQQVAEQAVNMVIRQIRVATAGNKSAWASQPGAIRTWDSGGKFEGGFKLYSDDQMVVTDETKLVDDDYLELTRWDTDASRFVDLNEPVVRGDKVYYPIVDPSARTLPEWPKNLGDDTNGVEGFFLFPQDSSNRGLIFDTNNTALPLGPMTEALQIAGRNSSDGIRREPLPMPAMWMYQLKDGSFGHLDSSRRFISANGGVSPSEVNPIVARFAFWTDDETCKLNPNIHAGGAAWATPMAGGDIDRNLGRYQPAQHEWQRYPGHPATTHIAPVLAPGVPDITYQRDNMEQIFTLVPRIVGGGSMSGTTKVDTNNPLEANGLIADKDRLYASLDEFLLEPGLGEGTDQEFREAYFFPDPTITRGVNDKYVAQGDVRLLKRMQDHVERTKFFLSVVSRAPEVTLFNTPRISIWPTHWEQAPLHSEKHHTVFDRLIRFCAEVGGTGVDPYEYHFQRYNADSAVRDYDDIKRNRELIDYLDKLTSENVPGFGKSFMDKYGSLERRQILTEIFDYIRCVNLHDDTIFGESWRDAFTNADANNTRHLTYTNGRTKSGNDRGMHKGHGQVTPIQMNIGSLTTKGMGRFYTLSEMGVVVIACGDAGDKDRIKTDTIHPLTGVARVHNPGMTEYGRGWIEDPSTYWKYSNLPPLPSNIESGAGGSDRNNIASYRDEWPAWLQNLAEKNPDGTVRVTGGKIISKTGLEGEDLLDMAFEEANWNWQLAWLDPAYAAAMPGDKFKRANVSRSGSDLAYLQFNNSEHCVQAALVWNMFSPSLGWVPINPDMLLDIQVEGMTFSELGGSNVSFGNGLPVDKALSNLPNDLAWASNRQQTAWHDRHYGGNKPLTYFLSSNGRVTGGLGQHNVFFPEGTTGNIPGTGSNGRISPVDMGYEGNAQYNRYPWVTRPFRTGADVQMGKGTVTVKIYAAGQDTQDKTERSAPDTTAQLVQTLQVPFPSFSVEAPTVSDGRNGHINEFGALQHGKTGPMQYWSLSRDGANPKVAPRGRMSRINGHNGALFQEQDVVQSVAVRHGDFRMSATQIEVTEKGNASDNLFQPHAYYNTRRMAHGFATTPGWRFAGSEGSNWKKGGLWTRGDEKRWLVDNSNDSKFVYHQNKVPFLMPADQSADVQLVGDFDNGMGNSVDGPYINKPDEGNLHSLHKRTDANAESLGLWNFARDFGDFPYFVRDWVHEPGTPSYFSPNRIISSPGQFGSLPVGTMTPWRDKGGNSHIGRPWRTLQFRPDVQGGIYPEKHPGSGVYNESTDRWTELPDHLLMDLFWMPVVEPYAISEPLSTGGKVNLNYQILPYHHIKRNTAIRGVFKSEYMLCIPNRWAYDYKIGIGRGSGYHRKSSPYGGSLQLKSLRTVILEDHTLYQFEKRFQQKRIFRTASEICDVHLVPEEIGKRMGFGGSRAFIGTTDFSKVSPEQAVAKMADGSYWSDHAAVGDNSRERPYSNIYARTTTKSNTYKVHYRAQILKKAKGGTPSQWDPLVDQVVAEYRGSSIVERYVDPNDKEIPDYATSFGGGTTETIDKFYKYRVLNPTRFSP